MGAERPKMEGEMTYLKKKNMYEAIHKKIRKKDVYESDMHKIYNIILGKINKQLQEKESSDVTFQEVKSSWDPIAYLMILKKIYLSNQS